jgi:hypothetical protein
LVEHIGSKVFITKLRAVLMTVVCLLHISAIASWRGGDIFSL